MVGGSDPNSQKMVEVGRVGDMPLFQPDFMVAEKEEVDTAKLMSDYIEKTGGAKAPSFNFTVNLDGELAQYGPDIRRFIEAMVYKLAKNAHKGKWEGLSIEEAFDLCKTEVYELQEEVHGTRNMVAVMLEAADVANFALIVAAIAMERGR